jgi:hypothetical protein
MCKMVTACVIMPNMVVEGERVGANQPEGGTFLGL